MMKPYRVDQQKWVCFSKNTQIKHIAAELSRATYADLQSKSEWRKGAYERAISMIDASLTDPQWKDRHFLYQLRDAIAALYIGKTHPAISNFIYSQLLNS